VLSHLVVGPAAHFSPETLRRDVVRVERLDLGVVERVPLVLEKSRVPLLHRVLFLLGFVLSNFENI
jgi:hypothetical protein